MQDIIFREYDIRGKVGSELIIDQVYPLTQAIVYYFLIKNPQVKTVAVGRDGRTHSPLIKDELVRALQDSGLNVIDIGVCTSPVLYFALYTQPVDAGIMITASHNPADYNGIKLCLGKQSVWGLAVKEIQQLYKQGKKVNASEKGSYTQHELIPTYVAWLAQHFVHLKNLDMSVVIDCGNGTAGPVLKPLIEKMAWQHVTLLYDEVDGTYPNHEADPTKVDNMKDVQRVLATTSTQLGIGLDGDADRMAPMTKAGYLVPGDKLLSLFSKQLLNEHPGAAVVMDIKSSAGLLELLDTWGAVIRLSPSGHAIIKNQMREHNALLGGELSCHFFFADRYFGYDDGIYAMLRLFEILQESRTSLERLITIFPHKISSSEIRIACAEEKKPEIIQAIKNHFDKRPEFSMITIDGVRASSAYGWGLVRPSNTQSELCLRFEADTVPNLERIKHDFFSVLHSFFNAQQLKAAMLIKD